MLILAEKNGKVRTAPSWRCACCMKGPWAHDMLSSKGWLRFTSSVHFRTPTDSSAPGNRYRLNAQKSARDRNVMPSRRRVVLKSDAGFSTPAQDPRATFRCGPFPLGSARFALSVCVFFRVFFSCFFDSYGYPSGSPSFLDKQKVFAVPALALLACGRFFFFPGCSRHVQRGEGG